MRAVVSEQFAQALQKHLRNGVGEQLFGDLEFLYTGVESEYITGVMGHLKHEFVPFIRDRYEASEFLYGSLPVRGPPMSTLYYQVSVVDIDGWSIPSFAQFALTVAAPIPESIVTPSVALSSRYIPYSGLQTGTGSAKDAFNQRLNWTPLVEALNGDKAAARAADVDGSVRVGKYKAKLPSGTPCGRLQLAPYRGATVITTQRVPAIGARPDGPDYAVGKVLKDLQSVARLVLQYPQAGAEVGTQFVMQSNGAMMGLVYHALDRAADLKRPRPRPPAPAVPAPPGPPATAPCPKCAKPVQVGFLCCPFCGLEIVWG